MRCYLVGALALVLFTSSALPHGSCYRGPSGDVPPGQRDPQPPGPPRLSVNATSKGTWEWWWSLNKEEFLFPKASRGPGRRSSPAGEEQEVALERIYSALETALRDKMTCPARSRVALAAGAVAASRGHAPGSLLERLRELSLDRGQQRVVQACTAIALGMTGHRDEAVVTALSGTVRDGGNASSPVRGAAVLALGLVGVSGSSDEPAGRLAASTLDSAATSTDKDLRACTLIAMGLDGSPARIPDILKALNDELDGTTSDFSDKTLSLAVTGLGKFADRDRRAHARAVVKLLRRMTTGAAGVHTRRAAVAALGRWGSIEALEDDIVREALDAVLTARKADDPLMRRLALLSIARLGAATDNDETLRRASIALTDALAPSGEGATPYAALSLGILCRSAAVADEARREIAGRLAGELRSLYEGTVQGGAASPASIPVATPLPPPPVGGPVTPVPSAPSSPDAPPVETPTCNRPGGPAPPGGATTPRAKVKKSDRIAPGAYALAIGLSGEGTAAPLLITILEDESAHSRLRGYAAVALGMLRSKPGIEAIRKVVGGTTDADLLVLGSIGAGLAKDSDLLPYLRTRAADKNLTNRERAMAIRALGKLGDRSAIPDLLKIVEKKGATDVLRSTAAIAIADLFDKDGALVLTRLTRDLSAYAKNDTFDLILSVF